MTHQPHDHEDLPTDQAAGAAERERRINQGLAAARHEDRRIDGLTAKRIARALDPGSGPLHEFAETGAVPEDMEADLAAGEVVARDLGLEEAYFPWIAALRVYLDGRLIKGPLPGWNDPSME